MRTPTFNSFSVAIGEAVCTIVEGTIATVQYVVEVITGAAGIRRNVDPVQMAKSQCPLGAIPPR